MSTYLDTPFRVRLSKDAHEKALKLLEDFPNDYENISCVLRAGIFALNKWRRTEGMKIHLEEDAR